MIELDVNPLLCDPNGVIALDGRIRVLETAAAAQARMAIRPYPQKFEGAVAADDGTSYFVRPIRPEDEPQLRKFALTIPDEDLWHNFFSALRDHTDEAAARLSQIDYDRELTLIALEGDTLAGIARMTAEPGFERAECAVLMRKDLWHRGLARPLMERLLGAAAMHGVKQAVTTVPANLEETVMLYEELGFTLAQHTGGAHPVVNFVRPLCG